MRQYHSASTTRPPIAAWSDRRPAPPGAAGAGERADHRNASRAPDRSRPLAAHRGEPRRAARAAPGRGRGARGARADPAGGRAPRSRPLARDPERRLRRDHDRRDGDELLPGDGRARGSPGPGKRGLRTRRARLGARRGRGDAWRARGSTTEADVRRAYVDLLLARDRLALLGGSRRSGPSPRASRGPATRSGEGAQSDVLRAQLELNRLRQRRCALEAQERTGRADAEPAARPPARRADRDRRRACASSRIPALPAPDAALEDAHARSPELAQARLGGGSGPAKSVELARRERYPDFSVNAGVMPRGAARPDVAGGDLASTCRSGRTASRAAPSRRARRGREASARGAEAIEQSSSGCASQERRARSRRSLETARLYREGLLVQSRGRPPSSTLAQYRVGRVTVRLGARGATPGTSPTRRASSRRSPTRSGSRSRRRR